MMDYRHIGSHLTYIKRAQRTFWYGWICGVATGLSFSLAVYFCIKAARVIWAGL